VKIVHFFDFGPVYAGVFVIILTECPQALPLDEYRSQSGGKTFFSLLSGSKIKLCLSPQNAGQEYL
jgi:hypothetical protein